MVPLILDALGACGFVLLVAARRLRARRAAGEAGLRRVGGMLLAIAVLGRLGAALAALARHPG